jgi:hypothetical protein
MVSHHPNSLMNPQILTPLDCLSQLLHLGQWEEYDHIVPLSALSGVSLTPALPFQNFVSWADSQMHAFLSSLFLSAFAAFHVHQILLFYRIFITRRLQDCRSAASGEQISDSDIRSSMNPSNVSLSLPLAAGFAMIGPSRRPLSCPAQLGRVGWVLNQGYLPPHDFAGQRKRKYG